MQDEAVVRCWNAYDWAGAGAGGEGGEGARAGGLLASLESFIAGGGGHGSHGGQGGGDSGVIFLPTAAHAILGNISEGLASHTLVLFDFDALPDVQVAGWNAPLIANTVGAVARDFATYLVPVGAADIFFPTNFDALASLYRAQMVQDGERSGKATSERVRAGARACADFFKDFADLDVTTTLSGYNPLIEDFRNTKVLIASRESESDG